MLVSLCSSKGHHTLYHATQRNVIEALTVDNKGLISKFNIPLDGEVTALYSCGASLLVGMKTGVIVTYDDQHQVSHRHTFTQSPIQHISQTRDALVVLTQDGKVHKHTNGTWVSSPAKHLDARAACDSGNSVFVATPEGIVEVSGSTLGESHVILGQYVKSLEYLPPYLISCRDRNVYIKTTGGLFTLKASSSISKLVARKVGEKVLILALLQDEIVNMWHLAPEQIKPGSTVSPKIIDLSTNFQGQVLDIVVPSDSFCVLGATDESGKLALIQISDLTRHYTIKCFTQESLSKEKYLAMSLGERIAYEKKISNQEGDLEAGTIDILNAEKFPTFDQIRTHLRSILVSSDKKDDLFTARILPSNRASRIVFRQAVSGLDPTEIQALIQLLTTHFATAPVERVRVLTLVRRLLECSADILTAETKETLRELNGEIGERMDVYKDLMRLHGRTKMLVTQLSNRKVSIDNADSDEEESESSEKEENNEEQSEDSDESLDEDNSEIESMEEEESD